MIRRVTSEGGFDRFRSINFNEYPTFFPNVSFDEECAQTSEKNCSDQDIEKLLVQGKVSVEQLFFNIFFTLFTVI